MLARFFQEKGFTLEGMIRHKAQSFKKTRKRKLNVYLHVD